MAEAPSTYRSYLQSLANSGNKEALGLLQVVGDDFRVNDTFQNKGTAVSGQGYSYDKGTINNLNSKYSGLFDANASPSINVANSRKGGSSTGGSSNAGQIAQYDQGIGNINSSIGRLDGELNAGYQNADTAYNSSVNKLLQAKADNEAGYKKNVDTTKQDYVGSKNTINVNTGNSLNALQRLLGSKGAGGSSAALISAPEAAARQGTLQRQGVGDTFGKNIQSLDTGWNNYVRDTEKEKQGYEDNRVNQRNQTLANVNNTRASLLQQLATLVGQKTSLQGRNATAASQGYLDEANNLLGQNAGLGVLRPVAQIAPSVYTPGTVADYTVNPNAAPTVNGQAPGSTDYASPFLQLLLGKKEQQNNLGA